MFIITFLVLVKQSIYTPNWKTISFCLDNTFEILSQIAPTSLIIKILVLEKQLILLNNYDNSHIVLVDEWEKKKSQSSNDNFHIRP